MDLKLAPAVQIKRLEIAPRVENILDLREVTVQTYDTTLPFDIKQIEAGLERAWLAPSIPLGVYSGTPKSSNNEIHVVLGLQVIERLPTRLRKAAELLMSYSILEVAELLDINRSSIHTCLIPKIERAFTEAGFDPEFGVSGYGFEPFNENSFFHI